MPSIISSQRAESRPNTSFVVASAAVMGLLAAVQTGQGQMVQLDMFGANAYANFDDFADVGSGTTRTRWTMIIEVRPFDGCIPAAKVG